MKRIYLFNIIAWNYRKKRGFPVCKKKNFAGLQAHKKRGKSARASPTPHHTLNEERSACFTAQPLSALVRMFIETSDECAMYFDNCKEAIEVFNWYQLANSPSLQSRPILLCDRLGLLTDQELGRVEKLFNTIKRLLWGYNSPMWRRRSINV